MTISRLEAHHFRNLAEVRLSPHPRFNLFFGDNAQGKTNLLEAIHLVLMRASFRTRRTAELVQHEARTAVVAAVLEVDESSLDIRVTITEGGRDYCVDGKRRAGAGRGLGLAAVLFHPEELRVLRGQPSERRRLLDTAILTVWPPYGGVLRDYGKALRARNRLLKEQGPGWATLASVYRDQLCLLGAKISEARVRYLEALQPFIHEITASVLDDDCLGEVTYESQSIPNGARIESSTKMVGWLHEQYERTKQQERRLRATQAGPHHDDVGFLLDGLPAQKFASQGQLRAMVLAFKMAQVRQNRTALGRYPVLLLDDVSSELDSRRSEFLFQFMKQVECQVFITSARPETVPLPEISNRFQVINGSVEYLTGFAQTTGLC